MTTNRRFVVPALVAAGILWGTTVPLSKVALGWLPPAWLACVRFALAAVVLLVASRSQLRAAFSPLIMITGAIGYGGSVLLQNFGIEQTSVTHAALLIGATPVLVAIFAAVLGHSVARPLAWAGFALSLAGVGFIAGGQGSGSSLGGDGLVLLAQLISAAFTVSQARTLRGRDPIAVTGLQLLGAGVLVLPVALISEHHAVGSGSVAAMLATLGLVVAGTVMPTSLFAFGQSRVSADVAGAFLNLEPLVGAVMGMALFAEPAGAVQLAGGAAITTGIGLSSFQVVRAESRARTGHQADASNAAETPLEQRRSEVPEDTTAPDGQVATEPAGVASLMPPGEAPSGQVATELAGVALLMSPAEAPSGQVATELAGVASRMPPADALSGQVAPASDGVASLLPPGEAPSLVKRTRLPTSARAGARRLRRQANSALRRPAPRLRQSRSSRRRSRLR